FSVTGTTAGVSAVTPVSPGVYDVTVSGGDLAGLDATVGLDLAAGQHITDPAGNPLPAAEPTTDLTYLVDNTPPESTVAAPPLPTRQTDFALAWSGTDSGSGIAAYDVFVAVDGDPFTLWQGHVTSTSAVYPGAPGHTYAFYSVATDRAGNAQPTPAAQATTGV